MINRVFNCHSALVFDSGERCRPLLDHWFLLFLSCAAACIACKPSKSSVMFLATTSGAGEPVPGLVLACSPSTPHDHVEVGVWVRTIRSGSMGLSIVHVVHMLPVDCLTEISKPETTFGSGAWHSLNFSCHPCTRTCCSSTSRSFCFILMEDQSTLIGLWPADSISIRESDSDASGSFEALQSSELPTTKDLGSGWGCSCTQQRAGHSRLSESLLARWLRWLWNSVGLKPHGANRGPLKASKTLFCLAG